MPFGEWNAGPLLNCGGVGALPAEPGFEHVRLTPIRNTPTTGEGTDSKSDQQRRLRLGCHSFITSPIDCQDTTQWNATSAMKNSYGDRVAPWKSAKDSLPSTEAGLHTAPWLCLSVHESYASGQRLERDLEKSNLWDKLIYGTVG